MLKQRSFKTLSKTLFLSAFLLASSSSFAAEQVTWFGETADGNWMAGLKFGAAELDIDGYSTAKTTALVIGYQFSRPIGDRGSASIELEIAESDNAKIDTPAVQANWNINTEALYMNYRSPGTVYFKTKVGVLHNEITQNFAFGEVVSDDVSFALGFGGGVRLGSADNRVNIEAEWVSSSGDHDVNYFSLGGVIEF